ncbi:MAG TPA: hypothetical protein ENJ82_14780 [Bacteroidetes bacterium]|nr:hypothetical protein [Bacteroidota bacterium]
MKTISYLFSIIIIAITLLSGCGQLSTLQTAKTLEAGEITVGGAVFGYGVRTNNSGGGNLGTGIFPHVEFMGRYGLGSAVDMGLKLSTGGNILMDGKYQFIGDKASTFAMAIGGGLELQGSNFSRNLIFRTHLPLYLSVHPSENDAIYAAPRFVWQYVSDNDNSYFLGGGLGYTHRFSDKLSILGEGSFYSPKTQNTNNDGTYLFQFGVGMVFHLNQ